MDAMKYALSVSISFCTILLLNNSWFHFSEILTHLMVLVALVWRCLLGLAPAYLVEFCGPTQSARSSRSLRSADRGLLRVPFARTSTRQKRAFAVAGPSIWNGLPLSI